MKPIKTLTYILAAVLAVTGMTTTAFADETANMAVSEADRAGIARVESYLNGISSLKADFLQVSSTGEVARGTFYLRRPGRLRVEYEESVPVLIVADGHRLIYYDKELETVNMVPIEDTLAAFLARPEIDFGLRPGPRASRADVRVTAYEHAKGLVRVTLVRREEPGAGSLSLTFDENPMRLRQWTVTDPQGVRTRVALEDIDRGPRLADELFEMPQPPESPW